MTTLTDKRCLSSWKSWRKKCEDIYDRAFPEAEPSQVFWQAIELIAFNFKADCAKRPITPMELDALEKAACKKFIGACVEERER